MKLTKKKISELNLAKYNPRKISEKALNGLKNSIKEFGYVEPIIWNKRTNTIVGGHQRVRALTELGETDVDVVEVDLDDGKEKALNISLNNQKIQGEWDLNKLNILLEELKIEIDIIKFNELNFTELSLDFKEKPIVKDDEFIVKDSNDTITKYGDLWLLGKHKLLCGDSTNTDDVKRLLAGKKPVLMVTDPPYGVNYDPEWRDAPWCGAVNQFGKASKGKVQNDDRFDWGLVFVLFDCQVIYCWHAGKLSVSVCKSIEEAGYEIVSNIIWAKQHFVISRGDYHWQHEPCWYAVKKGKNHNWQGARDQSTLWEIKNNNSFGNSQKEETIGHGTQKPIECMARPILNNSKEGELICDPFLGSGTTLIAAEKFNRVCFGMEIDAKYCDAVIYRWEKETGKKAVRG